MNAATPAKDSRAMNRFEQCDAMDRERAGAAATYLRLREAGRHAEAEPYGIRARALSKEIAKIVRTLKSTEPGGHRSTENR